jgi:mono/diheme cytochrome c family protein
MMRTAVILGALLLAAAAGGAAFVLSGVYDVSATEQHTQPVYWLLNETMRRSVKRRSADIAVPPLDDPAILARGVEIYREHCVQCHGAPGVAPEPFALGMTPLPANLALTAREWKDPADLYWTVKYGIKMSGMPAWSFRLSEDDLWAVVAFVNRLPAIGPSDYRLLAASSPAKQASATDNPTRDGDAARGRIALQQYACVTCHVVPGVAGAVHPVGPTLDGISHRKYLAGVLPNSRESMVEWLRFPTRVAPGTAMPDLGVSEQDALDIAAFLATLR